MHRAGMVLPVSCSFLYIYVWIGPLCAPLAVLLTTAQGFGLEYGSSGPRWRWSDLGWLINLEWGWCRRGQPAVLALFMRASTWDKTEDLERRRDSKAGKGISFVRGGVVVFSISSRGSAVVNGR